MLAAILLLLAGWARQAYTQDIVNTTLVSAQLDLANDTVRLPLYRASLPNGAVAFYIVTEASTKEAARNWGASHAPSLASAAAVVQPAKVAGATRAGTAGAMPDLVLPATVDFAHGKRSITPDPVMGFPPTNFSYSAQGDPGYSPLLQLPDGTILNAPHVAVQAAGGRLLKHPKVVAIAPDNSSVVLELTRGFSQGQPIVYISTDASDPLAAALENVPYVPGLAKTPPAALIDLLVFANGQTGANNANRQGLASAIKDGLSPLNIPANTPSSPAYSPLWAANLVKWRGAPGGRQTSVSAVQALAAAGKVSGLNPKDPSANPPLGPSGIVVNCPIIATLVQPASGGHDSMQLKMLARGCTPSPLGYSCVVQAAVDIKLHFSLGGASPPPNTCTSSARRAGAGASAATAAHFAVEAATPGFLAISFPATQSKMWPADAVIGFDSPSGGMPNVQSYHLSSYAPSAADATSGWADNIGYVNQQGRKLLCFSRALDASNAAVVKHIDPSAPLPLNWAVGADNALVKHSQSGSLAVRLDGGGTATLGPDDASLTAFRVAHGALMMAAFVLLMPAAVLMARHKYLFGDAKSGTISADWFKLHRILNGAALLLALAAVILIFVRFQWAGRAETASYYTGHRAVGMTAIAMVLVQALLGAVRPRLGAPARPMWRHAHQAWGWLTLLMATAASYMGISLIHDLSAIPLAYWLAPAGTVTSLMLVAGLALEVHKFKLERRGAYDKLHHLVGPSFPADSLKPNAAAPHGGAAAAAAAP